MKLYHLAFLVALVVGCAIASTTPEVIELAEQDFTPQIRKVPEAVWLVEFYAPWCGFCKKLVPIWEDLARALHSRDDIEFRVAKIDATIHKNIAQSFGVKGYPTIKLIKGDKYYDVNVPRTVEAFTELAEKGEWTGGLAFPPPFTGSTNKIPTGAVAPPMHTPEPENMFAFDIEKLPADVYRVVTKHLWATGILVVFGFLMGILAALICCFPNPKIVLLQPPTTDAPTGPKIKEE